MQAWNTILQLETFVLPTCPLFVLSTCSYTYLRLTLRRDIQSCSYVCLTLCLITSRFLTLSFCCYSSNRNQVDPANKAGHNQVDPARKAPTLGTGLCRCFLDHPFKLSLVVARGWKSFPAESISLRSFVDRWVPSAKGPAAVEILEEWRRQGDMSHSVTHGAVTAHASKVCIVFLFCFIINYQSLV